MLSLLTHAVVAQLAYPDLLPNPAPSIARPAVISASADPPERLGLFGRVRLHWRKGQRRYEVLFGLRLALDALWLPRAPTIAGLGQRPRCAPIAPGPWAALERSAQRALGCAVYGAAP